MMAADANSSYTRTATAAMRLERFCMVGQIWAGSRFLERALFHETVKRHPGDHYKGKDTSETERL